MKELHCSSKAYLGDLKHIKFNNTLSPRNNPSPNTFTKHQGPDYSSSHIAQSYIKQLKLKYHEYIRTQFTLLQYMHDEFGIDGTKYQFNPNQNEIEKILEESRVMVEKIVERWKTVEERERHMENMKEMVMLKATEANNRLAFVERQKRELEEIMVQSQIQGQSMKQNENLSLKLREVLQSQLNSKVSELNSLKISYDETNIELSNKQNFIQTIIIQRDNTLANNQALKQQILHLQNQINNHKIQISNIVSSYQMQLKVSSPNQQTNQSQLSGLISENKSLIEQIQILNNNKREYESERQSAMKSLNHITLRVKEYQRQHSEQKMINQQEMNHFRSQFKALQQKYLGIVMRSAKWNLSSTTLSILIQNTRSLKQSVECQTFDTRLQDLNMQKLMKQFQEKSQNRLHDLCRNNESLAKQNSILVKKLDIIQVNNQTLRRELDEKKIALKRINEQGSLLTEDMMNLDKEDVIKTIGTKIETLRDIMKSLENADPSEPSIDIRCKNNNIDEVVLQNLFEKKTNKSIQNPSKLNFSPKQIQVVMKKVQPQITQRRPSRDNRQIINQQHTKGIYLQTFPIKNYQNQHPVSSIHPANNYHNQHGSITSPEPFNQRLLSPTGHKVETKRMIPVGTIGPERMSNGSIRIQK